jgi:hypothetical protein
VRIDSSEAITIHLPATRVPAYRRGGKTIPQRTVVREQQDVVDSTTIKKRDTEDQAHRSVL